MQNNQDKQNIESIYALSPLQQGILFHSVLSPGSAVYFEQLSCTIEGEINVDAFEKAWDEILKRHSILRTAFVWKKVEKMLQVVYKEVQIPLDVIDWSPAGSLEQERRLEDFLQRDKQKGFQLNKAPLMRVALIVLNENKYQLVWSIHHILIDGWSRSMLLNEVFNLYDSYCLNKEVVQVNYAPYKNYIDWIESQDVKRAEIFWREKLKGFTTPVSIPRKSYLKKDSQSTDSYKCEKDILDKDFTNRLKTLARENKVTLNTVLLCTWALVLNRFSSEEDILFGMTVSGRSAGIPSIETMIGLFINTLPFRTRVDSKQLLFQWLKELHKESAEYRDFEYSSLVDIHECSNIERGSNLFDILFVFENFPVNPSDISSGRRAKVTYIRTHTKTNYPLAFVSAPEDELPLLIWFDENVFSEDIIANMIRHIKMILKFIALNGTSIPVSSIPALTQEEYHKIRYEWNEPSVLPEKLLMVHELFQLQAKKNPDAVALRFATSEMTYGKLDRLSDKLANYLKTKGAGPEVIIGVMAERSFEMIIAVLGVLKAGAAYMPLDPAYPDERIEYMLKDSGSSILLLHKSAENKIKPGYASITILDDLEGVLAGESAFCTKANISGKNLAYVIYTSGSTGKPKGVMLQHEGLSNTVAQQVKEFELTEGSRLLQFASFSFDASVSEIFTALTSGAMLQIVPKAEMISSESLIGILNKEKINVVTLPPSLLNNISVNEQLPYIKTVISAGEKCFKESAIALSKKCRFINAYGPTETTICSNLYIVHGFEETDNIPIGTPIENVRLYILGKNIDPVPLGATGELYIGGIGLARGYINRPELTADRFIPDMFSTSAGERLYRTGDLVRYMPDGNIEFLGRADNQVKLRGFRIELGEIEDAICRLPGIKQSAAVLKEKAPENKMIAAYYVTDNLAEAEPSELNLFLRKILPEYMIPSVFIRLEKIPLLSNGKTDKKALEKHDFENELISKNYVEPITETEETLVKIWKDILKLDQVGIYNNFFELGGHSLKATQLVSRIREAFNVEVPLREIFDNPTAAMLSEKIDQLKKVEKTAESPIAKRNDNSPLYLSYAQERLWFLEQLLPESNLYNIPLALRLEGYLNYTALEYSINQIMNRHEILRTVFLSRDGIPVQVISEDIPSVIELIDLSDQVSEGMYGEIKEIIDSTVNKTFDLNTGPLFSVTVIKLQDDEYILLIITHHIISDGWSQGIITREFTQLYESYMNSTKPALQELNIQYADYAIWQRAYLLNESFNRSLNYWKDKLKGPLAVLELPFDYPRKAVQTFNGKTERQIISKSVSENVSFLGNKAGATPYMVILSVFQLLLFKYTGSSDIIIGTPVAGRVRKEMENLIGFFVNTIVIRTIINPEDSYLELLKQVVQNCLEAFEHQNVPFEKLVEVLQPERNMSHSPLFQVAFIYQNFSKNEVKIQGLEIKPYELENKISKYDLSLTVIEENSRLTLFWEYNTDLFESDSICQMMESFEYLLNLVLTNPEEELRKYSSLSEVEKSKLLRLWNNTMHDYPSDTSAINLFESAAGQYPDSVALTFSAIESGKLKSSFMSYEELNKKANQLARFIKKRNIKHGELIAISLERSFEMIISILAVLKAGAAFVPVDPLYPPERSKYMLTDCSARLLITQSCLQKNFNSFGGGVICVDSSMTEISLESTENLNETITPGDLAYVIYTSGSTGMPKGTLLHHRGLCNLSVMQKDAFNIDCHSRILQFASLSFDASVWEIVMALLNNASLSIVTEEIVTSADYFIETVNALNITTFTVPPSLLSVIPEKNPSGGKIFSSLTNIIVAGEKCPVSLAEMWSEDYDFFNAYGPTETTVCATINYCGEIKKSVPIGFPIYNFKTYILDSFMNPVPAGTAGELYIEGPGLAYGYINRPDLTAEKFLPNPFCDEPGNRLYKTGDMVKHLKDGKLEFIGRKDSQIKLRGFRIETGEIVASLSEYPGINDCVVSSFSGKNNETKLSAYLVSNVLNHQDISEIKTYLRKRLPEYMIPSIFIFIDEIPRTLSGKIDYKALPAAGKALSVTSEFVAPGSDDEIRLAEIISGLLGIDTIGIYDNFFELGGHSLLAVQFISRIKETFNVRIPLSRLFENPSIAGIAEFIKSSGNSHADERIDKADEALEKQTVTEEDLDQMLREIEMLSDRQAEQMLLKEKNLNGNQA